MNWAVQEGNARVFHVRETLVPLNGSGDTSFVWAQLWLFLSLGAIACVVWSVLDRKRTGYDRLLYWLRTAIRYYLACFALSYGIAKLFATQMPLPMLSQLATPLGDLPPSGLVWLFMGYGVPYQVFAGAMEAAAGLLLLFRPTVTAGLLLAMGAFLNVAMINLTYNVAVKIFSLHLLFSSLFLLALDWRRLISFFVLNRGAPPTRAWEPPLEKPWQRRALMALKVLLVYLFLRVPFVEAWDLYKTTNATPVAGLFRPGVYEVKSWVVGADTIPPSGADTLRWNDVIFNNSTSGSIDTRDNMFPQPFYRRGWFRYERDSAPGTVTVYAKGSDFPMRYELPDTMTIRLHTVIRGDSVHMELVRANRHFRLAERQFHWVSEYPHQ
jgi:hypothetical protein